MGEPAKGIVGGDGREAVRDRFVQRRARSRLSAPEKGLELAECQLSRRELRRRRWQETDLAASRFDECVGGCALVDTEVVPDDGLARHQRRDEHLLDERLKGKTIDRPLDGHRRRNAVGTQGGNHGGIGTMIAWCGADDALPTWSTPRAGGHGEIRPALIDKDQRRRIVGLERCPPRGTRIIIPLSGEEDVF